MKTKLKTILIIIGLIIFYIGVALLESWVIAKLACFAFGLTYTTALFLRVAAIFIILNILFNVTRRQK